MLKRITRISLFVILVIFLLLGILAVAIRYPSVQTYLAHKLTEFASEKLNTTVTIERVDISLPTKAEFINFYMADRNGDTLISAKALEIDFKLFSLFKKKISISKIYLENGKCFLHRDSTGEKVNITELFSSIQADTTNSTAKPFSWSIDLKNLQLANLDFRYLDEKSHTDLKIKVPSCAFDISDGKIGNKLYKINSAILEGTTVLVDLLPREPQPEDTTVNEFHFLPPGMEVEFNDLQILKTRFSLNDHNRDSIYSKGMDFKHLDVKDIELIASNGRLNRDSVTGTIKQLAAHERSGFRLDTLRAETVVSVNEVTLSNLHLKTPNSYVNHYLSFRYNKFQDFKQFLKAVKIKADFDHTVFSLADLNYFVRQLDKVSHNKLSISGYVDGSVSSLKGKDIEISTGKSTILKGNFDTKGLPNFGETFVSLKVNRFSTSASDLQRFYPPIAFPTNLSTLGVVSYSGSLDGFLTDFVSNGTLKTAIGQASTDINFKYNQKTNKAFYKGELALKDFDMGKYFGDIQNLGKVSLITEIDGGGLTLESLQANLDGTIQSAVLKGYEYKNAEINGSVRNKSFNGSFSINDDHIDFDFAGTAEFDARDPHFNFVSNLRRADLKALNLSQEDIRIAGKVSADFTGSNPDNIKGSFDIKDARVMRDTVVAYSKYIKLNVTQNTATFKEVSLNADFAEAEMSGNFNFKDLPKALISFANHTLTENYTDSVTLNPQNFTLDFRIYEPGDISRIIAPKLTLIRNTRVQAYFNSSDQKLTLTASSPEIIYNNTRARDISVSSQFNNGNFTLTAVADKVYNADSLLLDTLSVHAETLENNDIRFDFAVSNKRHYNYAYITSYLKRFEGRSEVRLLPSDVKLANYNWHFNEGNVIGIEGKKITTNNLIFSSSDQAIYITSYLKNDTSTSFKLTLANTELGDFVGIFTQKMKDLHGAVNGKLVIEDAFYKPNVFADLVVDEFTLGDELVGDINIETKLDEVNKKVNLYASVKSVNNLLEAKGYLSIDNKNPELKLDIKAPRLGLNFLNYRFFDRYVKDCEGYAVVDAQVYGTPSKPLLSGSVKLINDVVTVSFLNTRYRIEDHTVFLDEHGFNIGDITIYDHRNKPIYGSGRINHDSFKNFALALKVNTPSGQFLNTTEKQSPNFYGQAYGSGNISFMGPINSPVIKAYAKTESGTYCKLPINKSFEINQYGFYHFVDKNQIQTTLTQEIQKVKVNGVNFILELEVTPDARMDIVLDPVAGDVLTSYGKGNLKIEIPKNGNTTIYGTYEIEQGKYLFTLQNIVNKPFLINKGGTINFTGDVYKARLNVDAVYEIRTSVNDLISDLISTSNSSNADQLESAARSRIPVKLLMNMTGVLEKPTIAFDIKTIDVDPLVRSYVDMRLALLKTNEKELNNQVFGLLVMNRFLPTQGNTGVSQTNYIGGTATNTVSEFLSSQFSNYLNNLIGYTNNEALKNFNVNIGYRQYDQTSFQSGNAQQILDTRREVQLALQQRLLNNRLTINAGGNLDFGNSTSVDGTTGSNRSVIPTGDFQILYALTKDRAWNVKAFNRTNYDYFNSRNTNRTGIGISYSKEFDTIGDLFKKKKKNKAPKKEEAKKEEETKPASNNTQPN